MRPRSVAAAAALAVITLLLAACTPGYTDRVEPGTTATLALSGAPTTLDPRATGSDTAADATLAALVHAGFHSRAADGTLVPEPLFGRVDEVSDEPLTVRYTVADGVSWSDGVPIDAADLLLSWVVGTTHRVGGDADAHGHPATWWGAGSAAGYGLDLVSSVPELGGDGRSATLVYDRYDADWRLAFDAPAVPAHVIVAAAYPDDYGTDDAGRAKDDFVAAVQRGDLAWLAPVSAAYRDAIALADGAHPVTSGPYRIDEIADGGARIRLSADPGYAWGGAPTVESVTLDAVPDAADRADAVARGDADLAVVAATEQLVGSDHARVAAGTAYDHIDLQVAAGGVFDAARYGGDEDLAQTVRRAFLDAVPRQRMLDEIVRPLLPDATLRTSSLAPGDGGATAAPADTAAPVDPASIAAALAAAGVPAPTVRVLYPAGDARRAAEFARLADAAAQAGISVVDASRTDWQSALASDPGSWDAALFAWDPDPSAELGTASVFATGAAQNVYGWSDAQVDGLLADAAAEADPAARADLLRQAEDAVTARAWTLPLFDVPVATLSGARVAVADAVSSEPGLGFSFVSWRPEELKEG